MPVSILQLTDPHIGAEWRASDPLDTLRAVLAEVRALPQRPAAPLLTGDLTNGGRAKDYSRLRELLDDELGLPLHVLPGNHDDRAELRRWFEVGGRRLGGRPAVTIPSTYCQLTATRSKSPSDPLWFSLPSPARGVAGATPRGPNEERSDVQTELPR